MPITPVPDGEGRPPQPLGKALDRVMRGLGAPEASGVHLVFDRWTEVVGEALAARTKPLRIDGSKLVLAVADELTHRPGLLDPGQQPAEAGRGHGRSLSGPRTTESIVLDTVTVASDEQG